MSAASRAVQIDSPRPECAPLRHDQILEALPNLGLTLLVGLYAQARYLGDRRKGSLTETVRAWRDYAPAFLPLPHPSWRNTAWLKKNPRFETDLLPDLRRKARAMVKPAS
ncbi:MAG: uracil-DNA glycosylase family protein [Kiloniellales bacterium]|nr:uracil-DNA glycosylase family protein [Kiloniellales bacterium]